MNGQDAPPVAASTSNVDAAVGQGGPPIDVHAVVAQTTAEVLATESPGDQSSTSESFTDLGGDSLSAVTLAEVLSGRLGIDVPIDLVFDAGDLSELADQLAQLVDGAQKDAPTDGS